MTSKRNTVIQLYRQGRIPDGQLDAALATVGVTPDQRAWRRFLNQLLLWVGTLAMVSSLAFFVAYNWHNVGRFTKFALVQALLIVAVAAYWKLDKDRLASKASLLASTLLLGVLLALYGQVYQTGADTWQLFFSWALLMLPWAFIGRFPALWLLWIALLNLAIILYQQTFRGIFGLMFSSDSGLLWLLFLFNTAVLIVWEVISHYHDWLAERWAARLLGLGSGVPLTLLVLDGIFSGAGNPLVPLLLWCLWLAAIYLFYRRQKPDLFMLAGGCLSVIVVIISLYAKYLLDDLAAAGFLFLGLLIVGLGGGTAIWLKNVNRELES